MPKKEHIDDENLLNNVKDISDKKKYTLTRSCIICVFIYYSILIIVGLINQKNGRDFLSVFLMFLYMESVS